MATGDGMVVMTPTSVTYVGTSATINANGGVDFSGVSSIALNGVFTSAFDNYRIYLNTKNSSIFDNVPARLRAGTTDAAGLNYTRQYIFATATSVNGGRSASVDYMYVGGTDETYWCGSEIYIYGPYLAQPTASRNIAVTGELGGYVTENVCSHSLSTSYHGISLFLQTNGEGNVVVFGYEE